MDPGDLYRKHASDVFRFALYLSGNRNDAEDLTSETFVHVWTAPDPVRAATVKGLLLTITRHLFLQGRRRKRREVSVPDDLPDPAAGPLRDFEVRSEVRAVIERLQQLSEVDRAALLMGAVEGVPYSEVARALGISLASVKVKIYRARLKLAGVSAAEVGGVPERKNET
jgi:RNA polymerase sigma-70 factor (ECF subfamily)